MLQRAVPDIDVILFLNPRCSAFIEMKGEQGVSKVSQQMAFGLWCNTILNTISNFELYLLVTFGYFRAWKHQAKYFSHHLHYQNSDWKQHALRTAQFGPL